MVHGDVGQAHLLPSINTASPPSLHGPLAASPTINRGTKRPWEDDTEGQRYTPRPFSNMSNDHYSSHPAKGIQDTSGGMGAFRVHPYVGPPQPSSRRASLASTTNNAPSPAASPRTGAFGLGAPPSPSSSTSNNAHKPTTDADQARWKPPSFRPTQHPLASGDVSSIFSPRQSLPGISSMTLGPSAPPPQRAASPPRPPPSAHSSVPSSKTSTSSSSSTPSVPAPSPRSSTFNAPNPRAQTLPATPVRAPKIVPRGLNIHPLAVALNPLSDKDAKIFKDVVTPPANPRPMIRPMTHPLLGIGKGNALAASPPRNHREGMLGGATPRSPGTNSGAYYNNTRASPIATTADSQISLSEENQHLKQRLKKLAAKIKIDEEKQLTDVLLRLRDAIDVELRGEIQTLVQDSGIDPDTSMFDGYNKDYNNTVDVWSDNSKVTAGGSIFQGGTTEANRPGAQAKLDNLLMVLRTQIILLQRFRNNQNLSPEMRRALADAHGMTQSSSKPTTAAQAYDQQELERMRQQNTTLRADYERLTQEGKSARAALDSMASDHSKEMDKIRHLLADKEETVANLTSQIREMERQDKMTREIFPPSLQSLPPPPAPFTPINPTASHPNLHPLSTLLSPAPAPYSSSLTPTASSPQQQSFHRPNQHPLTKQSSSPPLPSDIATLQTQLATLTRDHARLVSLHDMSRSRFLATERKFTVCQDENTALLASNEKLAEEMSMLRGLLNDVRSERDRWRDVAGGIGGQWGSIVAGAAKLELLSQHDRAAARSLDEERRELRAELDRARAEIERLKEEVDNLRERVGGGDDAGHEGEGVRRLKRRVAELEETLRGCLERLGRMLGGVSGEGRELEGLLARGLQGEVARGH